MRINPDIINSISDNIIDISSSWAWVDVLAYSPRYTETFTQPISLEATTLDFCRFKEPVCTITIRETADPTSPILWSGISYNIADDGNDINDQPQPINYSTGCVGGVEPAAVYGVGTISISSTFANLCSDDKFQTPIETYYVTGNTFTLTDGTEQYLVIDYNNGIPIYRIENNKYLINDSNIILIRVVWRCANNVHSIDSDCLGLGLSNKLEAALISTTPYKISNDGGMSLSESSSPAVRTVLITSAVVFGGSTSHIISAFNSSVNKYTVATVVNSSWTYTSGTTQYNNTQYNGYSGLSAVGNNKYSVVWMYRSIGNDIEVFQVLGTTDYPTIAAAQQERPRSDLSIMLRDHCMLVGRIIIQKNATSGLVENVSDTVFYSGVVTNHNDLQNIQGGATGEYYHLSATTFNLLTSGGNTSLHYHNSDRTPENISVGYTTNPWYLNTHPEGNGVTVPFINNDLAHLIPRGGAMTSYYTTATDYTISALANTGSVTIGTSAPFDGSPSYSLFSISATGAKVVIDINCPVTYAYSTTLYIDFGNYGFQARDVTFLAYQSVNNSESVYKVLGSTTSNYIGRFQITNAQYTYVNTSSATGYGFNRLRIVLSTFTNKSPRIACIGLINYNSAGVNNVYLSRAGANMFGSINPNTTSAYSLGTTSNRWLEVHAGTYYENGSTLSSKYQLRSEENTALGYAGLDASAKIPVSLLPDVVVGQLHYQGIWDASTNTPALPIPSSNKGMYYIVSVSGTTTIANCSPYTINSDWKVGDWLISDGVYWDKIDNTDAISSWNSRVGAIIPIKSDYSAWFVDLAGIYSNPTWITSLDASKITTSTTLQFVSDTEKSLWNSKQPGSTVLSNIAALTTGSGFLRLSTGVASLDTNNYTPYVLVTSAVDFNTINSLVNYDGTINVFGSSYSNGPSGIIGGGGGGSLFVGYGANAGSWQTQLFVNGQQDKLQFRVQGNNSWSGGWHTVWHDGNLTNLNQLANGPGYVTDTALSTWAGSTNITTVGTLTTGTVPWTRLSNIPFKFGDYSNISYEGFWPNSGTVGSEGFAVLWAKNNSEVYLNSNTAINLQTISGATRTSRLTITPTLATFANNVIVSGLTASKFIKTDGSKQLISYDLTSSDITTALGFTPINKAGDTGIGSLTLIGALSGTTGSFSGTMTVNGGILNLNNSTSNLLAFNNVGVGAPTYTTRSAGTKIVLYSGITSSTVDYGFGIEGSALWSSIPNNTGYFKWYAGTTNVATLGGNGDFAIIGSFIRNGNTVWDAGNLTFGTGHTNMAYGDHNHATVYHPLNGALNLTLSASTMTVASTGGAVSFGDVSTNFSIVQAGGFNLVARGNGYFILGSTVSSFSNNGTELQSSTNIKLITGGYNTSETIDFCNGSTAAKTWVNTNSGAITSRVLYVDQILNNTLPSIKLTGGWLIPAQFTSAAGTTASTAALLVDGFNRLTGSSTLYSYALPTPTAGRIIRVYATDSGSANEAKIWGGTDGTTLIGKDDGTTATSITITTKAGLTFIAFENMWYMV
jgi:hypothetical protein